MTATNQRLDAQQNALDRALGPQAAAAAEIGRLAGDVRARQEGLLAAIDELRALALGVASRQDAARSGMAALAAKIDSAAADRRAREVLLQADVASVAATCGSLPRQSTFPVVHAGNNIVASLVDGFIVGVPGEEWRLAAYHAFRGVLEPGLARRFQQTVKPGMIVVDAGANVGIYTLYAARLCGETGKVFSFEPTPRTFAILKDNIQINGFLESGVVDLRRAALSDRSGCAQLAIYPDNNGHNTLFPAGGQAGFVEVETTSLDEALAGVPRVDVVKIDTEGSEPLIWRGMRALLERNPQAAVFLEFAPSLLTRAGFDPGEFLTEIEAGGFAIERVDDNTGEVAAAARDELLRAFSANLMLRRRAG